MKTYERRGDNGRRGGPPDQIQADLDSIRSRMDATFDALQYQLSPTAVFEELWGMLRQRRGGAQGVLDLLRDNPVPAGLIGAGLAFLLLSGREASRARRSGEATDRARAAGGELKGRASEGMEVARRGLSAASERGSQGVQAAKQQLGAAASTASELGGKAEELGREVAGEVKRAGQRSSELLHEQPLVVAGLGLALGAALGAVVPRSRVEDRLAGPRRDAMLERATAAGREALWAAQRATRSAMEAGGERAREELSRSKEEIKHAAAPSSQRDAAPATPPDANEGATAPKARHEETGARREVPQRQVTPPPVPQDVSGAQPGSEEGVPPRPVPEGFSGGQRKVPPQPVPEELSGAGAEPETQASPPPLHEELREIEKAIGTEPAPESAPEEEGEPEEK